MHITLRTAMNLNYYRLHIYFYPYIERHIEFSLLAAAWLKKLESYRDWFLEQDNMKSDESKRIRRDFNSGDLFGLEGSFRQLNVD
jgi:hypothetical protein